MRKSNNFKNKNKKNRKTYFLNNWIFENTAPKFHIQISICQRLNNKVNVISLT